MIQPSLIAQFRKYLIAAVGYAGSLLAYGFIPAPYDKYVAGVLAFLASIGVGVVKNVLTTKQLLAQPNYLPATSIVSMPLGHPDAIKQALTVADDPGANRVRYFEGLNQRFEEAHPRGEGGKFRKKGTTA
jgi:hypothetical protein